MEGSKFGEGAGLPRAVAELTVERQRSGQTGSRGLVIPIQLLQDAELCLGVSLAVPVLLWLRYVYSGLE